MDEEESHDITLEGTANDDSINRKLDKILKELATQRTMLDFICQNLPNKAMRGASHEASSIPMGSQNEEFLLPIDCSEKLDNLELSLLNEDTMNKLVCMNI